MLSTCPLKEGRKDGRKELGTLALLVAGSLTGDYANRDFDNPRNLPTLYAV